MVEELREALVWVLSLLAAGLSWWNKTMWQEIKDLRVKNHDQVNEINKLNLLVVGQYMTRTEMQTLVREMTHELGTKIDRMEDKIDSQLADIYDELKHKVDKA